eukprot:CAMPEP_0183351318 /NCGR_PEP_ID=MMETSP0164_2-20130417/23813_1 /TAXON_ID=221442 /ORGANISM="Coccolithus pelagicus ssp braarudi, Strain PLY182g" /LENGTH=86 /DNA_ID=CAMNT_0025523467 /DNA_START=19 /DNA_END=279 /DNA_ORIENTATION=+
MARTFSRKAAALPTPMASSGDIPRTWGAREVRPAVRTDCTVHLTPHLPPMTGSSNVPKRVDLASSPRSRVICSQFGGFLPPKRTGN